MCVYKIETKITFKVNAGYCLKSLTSETTKLLRSTKSKVAEDENGKSVHHLDITPNISAL